MALSSDLKSAFPESPPAKDQKALDLITHVRDRPGHDRRYAIDFGKAQRELGYAPKYDLQKGLRETLEWYVTHTGWWRPLLGRDYAAWVEMNYKRH